MFFPANLIVALILAILYIFIAFKLKFPQRLHNFFRVYSILIQTSFVLFLMIFSFFLYLTMDNSGIRLFAFGLDIFYLLITFPLAGLIIYRLCLWLMDLDSYSIVLRLILFAIILTFFVVILFLGYSFFILLFYGFAP